MQSQLTNDPEVPEDIENEARRLQSLTAKHSLYDQNTLASLPPFVLQALQYGLIKPGYDYTDYMNEAWHGDIEILEKYGIKKQGFGEAIYWAPQGTMKSNLSLQHGFTVYGDWDTVLKRNIMTMEELVELYQEAREAHTYIPWVNIDDVSMVFSKQLWFERGDLIDQVAKGRDIYIQFEKVLAGIRRRVSWLSFSTPYPENLIRILQKNLSYEIWVYPRSGYIVNKYIRLIDPYREGKSNLRKIVIEHSSFNPRGVSQEVWDKYSEKREHVDNMVFRPLEEVVEAKGGKKKPKPSVTQQEFVEKARLCGIKSDNRNIRELWKLFCQEPLEDIGPLATSS